MKRDLEKLSRQTWDVLVIGGGVHGSFIAREAALRGLSVALVEKSDFASATSSNSQKIVHSGLRYLQHGDLGRLRQSIRERSVLLLTAPHLVRLLPVLVPAYGHGRRGPALLALAMAFHDLVGLDRNRGLESARHIPRGRIVSIEECRKLFPEVNQQGLAGGALWYDCQIFNTERLILGLLHDVSSLGGLPVNYLEVTGFLPEGPRLGGAIVRDRIEGGEVRIRSRVTVNAAGPWLAEVCRMAGASPPEPLGLSRALVLVVDRPLVKDIAVGLPGSALFRDPDAIIRRDERFFFITPWRGRSLVGSAHLPFAGSPDECGVSDEEIEEFLTAVNTACPAWSLRRQDVSRTYCGLLPTAGIDRERGSIQVEKKQKIRDHLHRGGPEDMISVLSVKYTTARDAAVKAVQIIGRKLNRRLAPGTSTVTPIYGGSGGSPEKLIIEAGAAEQYGLADDVLVHLVSTYGSAWGDILSLIERDGHLAERVAKAGPVTAAEIAHGIREEMALKLTDIVLRRTELGSAGHPGQGAIERCADIAAAELCWDGPRRESEIEEVERALA